jgi:splicing factor 3B subunit 3
MPAGNNTNEMLQIVTIYELDLGLNHVVRKWSEAIDMSSHKLIMVPGGNDGPSGVLVCSENFITWMHPDYPPVRIPIPARPDIYGLQSKTSDGNSDESSSKHKTPGSMIISSVVHKLKKGFFILVQTEGGDLFKLTMDYSTAADGLMGGVDALYIKYFDTVPPASSLILLKTGFLFVGCEFGNHYLYQIENLGDDDEEQVTYSSADIPQDDLSFSVTFQPRDLRNIVPVDELPSLSPVLDVQIANIGNEESPQQYALCGRGSRSSFRILRHGLEVTEMAVSELPGNPHAVWTVRATAQGTCLGI